MDSFAPGGLRLTPSISYDSSSSRRDGNSDGQQFTTKQQDEREKQNASVTYGFAMKNEICIGFFSFNEFRLSKIVF